MKNGKRRRNHRGFPKVKDEYKKVQIPFGWNAKLGRILLSLFHTFFVAMTGHGKTLGMKSLLYRFRELYPDWKILIIDSKDKRDYADLNADIPICFVETTDPLELKSLLEPVVGSNMMYFFDKIIEESVFDTLGEVQRSIHQKVEDADAHRIKIHGKDLGKLRVLDYVLGKLVELVEKPNIIKELKLHDGFNVMPVSLPEVKNQNRKRAFQQLIVRSALLLLLSDSTLEKTLLVLDESHKWSPQKYSSICKQPISEFISEGRSQDKILWVSDQALTKVDKEPLKNIKLWLVGQQMEDNEVEDAKNTVNDITDLTFTDADIKRLRIGNFIFADGLHRTVEKVYLQPYGVPDSVALEIAGGADPELAEPYILKFEQKSQLISQVLESDEEMVYKEKFEKLQKEFQKFQEATESERKATKKLREDWIAFEEKNKKLQDDFDSFKDGTKELKKQFEDASQQVKDLKVKLEKFEALQQAFRDLFGIQGIPASEAGVRITLGASLTEISLEDNVPKEVSVTTQDPSGKIMFCAVKLHNKALKTDPDTMPILTSAALQKEAAEYGWQLTNMMIGKTMGYIIREGWMIKEGNGYRLPAYLKINVPEVTQQ